jgi:hypothetical protein
MKENRSSLILPVTVVLYCLCTFSVYATKINSNHDMYKELYNFLVSRNNIEKNANKNIDFEDLVDVDPITLDKIDFSKEFAVYRFKFRGSSDTYIYVLIKYKTSYWIYNTWDVAGIFEELVNIRSDYQQLNDQQIVRIVEKVRYPKKQLIETFGKLKFVYDL